MHETYADENFDIPASETETAGTHYFTRVFHEGDCDSVIVLRLQVHPEYDLHFTETIPEGYPYDNHGIFLSESLLEGGDHIDTSITYQSVYGCDSVIHVSVAVAVTDIVLYLPNAITPSKSDGVNDVFSLPERVKNQIKDFEIMIFNRWGEMVFYSTDPGFQWNGEYKGKTFYNNVYQYVVHYSNMFGKRFTKKGSITVL
jgi:gliding motility-associated-like protein